MNKDIRKYIFSGESMLNFYRKFDPLALKYDLPDRLRKDDEPHEEDYAKKALKIMEYESSKEFSSLTKRDYASDYANFNLVYGEQEENQNNLELMSLVFDKVICQYIAIDGIERLFSEKYIEFEWEMHLSADYKKHNMKFYRDHFIHQIRDAYMMHVMLRDYDFYSLTQKILKNGSENKVSRYVCKMLKQQEYSESTKLRELHLDSDFYIRNLIYMSCYMAGLFHDIGYPEVYYRTTSRHITDYISDLYSLHGEKKDIGHIYSTLQNSLLFRLVPMDKIEKRISNEKPDHGVLSAIIFLLHFYKNGAIYRLEPYKCAAVELAALAIFNHTNIYRITSDERDTDAYRPCFHLNPISYLLRLCDDLQEWDRTYFVISNKSNALICNRCRTPIIRKNGRKERKKGSHSIYACNCKWVSWNSEEWKDAEVCFSQAFDGDAKFPYRRIYNVSVCDKLELESSENQRQNKIVVHLNYDLSKLLHISFVNPTYAKYRIKELNSLKKLLKEQRGIPAIYLDYFVTSNPVHIKVRMLEEYFSAALSEQEQKDMIPDLDKMTASELDAWMKQKKEYLQLKIMPIVEACTLHENLCRNCGMCENYVNALEKGLQTSEGMLCVYSSGRNEVLCRSMSWIVMKGEKPEEIDADKLRDIISDNKELCALLDKLVERKEMAYPDFRSMTDENYKHKKEAIFFGRESIPMDQAVNEISSRCPVNRIKCYLTNALELYIGLYLCQLLYEENNVRLTDGLEDYLKSKGREYSEMYREFPELRCLVEDCFLQFPAMYRDFSKMKAYPDKYFEQYANGERHTYLYGENSWIKSESRGFYYTALARYIEPEEFNPILNPEHTKKSDKVYIDAYTDLYFFQILAEETQEKISQT